MDDRHLTGLIRGAQGGDIASIAELLDLHYATIYRIAWKWCGHRTNAEDIAQQSCIKLAGSLRQFRFQAAFTYHLRTQAGGRLLHGGGGICPASAGWQIHGLAQL